VKLHKTQTAAGAVVGQGVSTSLPGNANL